MRNGLIASLVLSVGLMLGCNGNTAPDVAETPTTTQAHAATTGAEDMTPEQLGELGAEIGKNPEKAEEILQNHGLDDKSYEAAIRKVTEDPDASKRYADAYARASA